MSSSSRPWFVYLLECRDGTYYTGISTDVAARFAVHQAGKGARYTRAHPPLRILAMRAFVDKSTALRAEHSVKKLPKSRKVAWFNCFDFI